MKSKNGGAPLRAALNILPIRLIRIIVMIFMPLTAPTLSAREPVSPPYDKATKSGILDNGFRYRLERDPAAEDAVKISFRTGVGYSLEQKDETEISHLIEHLLVNFYTEADGTRRSFRDLFRSWGLEPGGAYQAYTNETETRIEYAIAKDRLPDILALIRNQAHNAGFTEIELQNQRGIVIAETLLRPEDGAAMAGSLIYSKFVRPSEAIAKLRSYPLSKVSGFYENWYVPSNQEILISGEIDIQTTEKQVISSFSDIPANIVGGGQAAMRPECLIVDQCFKFRAVTSPSLTGISVRILLDNRPVCTASDDSDDYKPFIAALNRRLTRSANSFGAPMSSPFVFRTEEGEYRRCAGGADIAFVTSKLALPAAINETVANVERAVDESALSSVEAPGFAADGSDRSAAACALMRNISVLVAGPPAARKQIEGARALLDRLETIKTRAVACGAAEAPPAESGKLAQGSGSDVGLENLILQPRAGQKAIVIKISRTAGLAGLEPSLLSSLPAAKSILDLRGKAFAALGSGSSDKMPVEILTTLGAQESSVTIVLQGGDLGTAWQIAETYLDHVSTMSEAMKRLAQAEHRWRVEQRGESSSTDELGTAADMFLASGVLLPSATSSPSIKKVDAVWKSQFGDASQLTFSVSGDFPEEVVRAASSAAVRRIVARSSGMPPVRRMLPTPGVYDLRRPQQDRSEVQLRFLVPVADYSRATAFAESGLGIVLQDRLLKRLREREGATFSFAPVLYAMPDRPVIVIGVNLLTARENVDRLVSATWEELARMGTSGLTAGDRRLIDALPQAHELPASETTLTSKLNEHEIMKVFQSIKKTDAIVVLK